MENNTTNNSDANFKSLIAEVGISLSRFKTYFSDNAEHRKALDVNTRAIKIVTDSDDVQAQKEAKLLALISAHYTLSEVIPNVNAPNVLESHKSNLEILISMYADVMNIDVIDAKDSFIALGGDYVSVIKMAEEMTELGYSGQIDGFLIKEPNTEIEDTEDVINDGLLSQESTEVITEIEDTEEKEDVKDESLFGEQTEDSQLIEATEVITEIEDTEEKEDVKSNSTRTYGTQTNSEGQLVDNVPWEDEKEQTEDSKLSEDKEDEKEEQLIEQTEEKEDVKDVVTETLVDLALNDSIDTDIFPDGDLDEDEDDEKEDVVDESDKTLDYKGDDFKSEGFKVERIENYKIAKGKKTALKKYLEEQDMSYVMEDIEVGEILEFETEIVDALREFLIF